MFNKAGIVFFLLECTLVVKPVLKSCQVCCVSDSITACRFVKDCSQGLDDQPKEKEKQEPATGDKETEE